MKNNIVADTWIHDEAHLQSSLGFDYETTY